MRFRVPGANCYTTETGLSFGCFEHRCVKYFLKASIAKLLLLKSNLCFGLWTGIGVVPGQFEVSCFVCVGVCVVRLGVKPWRGCKSLV